MSIFHDNGDGLCAHCGLPLTTHYRSDGRCLNDFQHGSIECDHNYVIKFRDKANVHFERHGEAIGGLIFDTLPGGQLELIDFDGAYVLPRPVTKALRAFGFHVDTTFD